MTFQTSYKRAHNHGAAHEGTQHFWLQRITSIALVPLGLAFLWPFASALGQEPAAVRAIYQNGWNAFVAINFLLIGFWHLKQGNQVVIEDYVHTKGRRLRLLIANIFLCWSMAAASVMAVVSIWLGS